MSQLVAETIPDDKKSEESIEWYSMWLGQLAVSKGQFN